MKQKKQDDEILIVGHENVDHHSHSNADAAVDEDELLLNSGIVNSKVSSHSSHTQRLRKFIPIIVSTLAVIAVLAIAATILVLNPLVFGFSSAGIAAGIVSTKSFVIATVLSGLSAIFAPVFAGFLAVRALRPSKRSVWNRRKHLDDEEVHLSDTIQPSSSELDVKRAEEIASAHEKEAVVNEDKTYQAELAQKDAIIAKLTQQLENRESAYTRAQMDAIDKAEAHREALAEQNKKIDALTEKQKMSDNEWHAQLDEISLAVDEKDKEIDDLKNEIDNLKLQLKNQQDIIASGNDKPNSKTPNRQSRPLPTPTVRSNTTPASKPKNLTSAARNPADTTKQSTYSGRFSKFKPADKVDTTNSQSAKLLAEAMSGSKPGT